MRRRNTRERREVKAVDRREFFYRLFIIAAFVEIRGFSALHHVEDVAGSQFRSHYHTCHQLRRIRQPYLHARQVRRDSPALKLPLAQLSIAFVEGSGGIGCSLQRPK